MTSTHARHRRPAYVAGVALMFSGLLLVFLVVLAEYATTDMAQQRRAQLAAHAEQILQSARAWSQRHVNQLAGATPAVPPIDELVPSETSSTLELHAAQTEDGQTLVECRLRLRRGRATVFRQVRWPLTAPHSALE
jgi:hypothetical protein